MADNMTSEQRRGDRVVWETIDLPTTPLDQLSKTEVESLVYEFNRVLRSGRELTDEEQAILDQLRKMGYRFHGDKLGGRIGGGGVSRGTKKMGNNLGDKFGSGPKNL